MTEPVRLRGAGGAVFEFDMPLREHFVEQLVKGELEPVDEVSASVVAGAVGEALAEARERRAAFEEEKRTREQRKHEARERLLAERKREAEKWAQLKALRAGEGG